MSCLLMRLRCVAQCSNARNVTSFVSSNISQTMQRITPFVCWYCRRVKIFSYEPVIFHNTQCRNSTTYTRLRELMTASKNKRRRRSKLKYVELMQVSGSTELSVTERYATVKKSTAAKVLQKLGVTSVPVLNPSSSQMINPKKSILQPDSTRVTPNRMNDVHINPRTVESKQALNPVTRRALLTPAILSPRLETFSKQTSKKVEIIATEKNPMYNSSSQFNSVIIPEDNFLKAVENVVDVHDFHNHTMEKSDLVHTIIKPSTIDSDVTNLQKVTDLSSKTTVVPASKRDKRRVVSKVIKKKLSAALASKDLDAATRFARLQFSLASYLDVCINSNMLQQAHDVLLRFHKRNLNSNGQYQFNVNLYNLVLQGWATEGNWNPLYQLLEKMNNVGPKPNLRSYAAALECIGRMPKLKSTLVRGILDKIDQHGMNVKNIFVDGFFVRDQKEVVLKVIRSSFPDFEPFYPGTPVGYSCELLQELNQTYSQNRHYTPGGPNVTLHKLKQAAKSQMDLELQGQVSIKSIQKKKPATAQTATWTKVLSSCESDWSSKLAEVFSHNVNGMAKLPDKYGLSLYPYLKALDSKVYVGLMMQEVSNLGQLSEAFSPLLSTLQRNLGVKIMEHYLLQKKKKDGFLNKLQLMYGKFCEYYADPSLTSKFTPRQYWEKLARKHCSGPDLDVKDQLWPSHILVGIGKFMYDIIIKNIKIDTHIFRGTKKAHLSPAFYTIYRRHDTVKIREEIKPHPLLVKLYQLANRDELIFDAPILPMLSPPLPWSSLHSGGFLLSSAQLVRYPQEASDQQKAWLERIPNKQLYPVLDALNQLSECAWIINKPILDLVVEVFNNKGSVELDIPQPTSECPALPKVKSEMTKREIAEVMQARSSLKQQKAEMYSLWCDMLYKLSIANQYRDDIIWFPHNMDFRGRVYPCPPHFNHLGSDVSRSLLMFAKGEPLGEVGLKWLKIHVINLTGLKKRSPLDERLAYCDAVISNIMDSADNPLTGKKWWMQSDEPWQTLACCIELTKALRSPDPHAYICHLPVHQDGSCNGLQHYAALGCDEQGANQVNLEPQEHPQDVYSGVAELVERERAKDAANGVKIAQVLEGFVSRRVVKQPVMTTVYGVTRFGARLQIIRQLKDLPDFPQEYKWQAASYLVGKTFFSLQEMFSSTKHIQDWLTQCATLISQVRGEPVEWLTPLEFPIVQPYFRRSKLLQKHSDGKSHSVMHTVPNTRKQKNAFPPNYIHSLDSTHMMLTALFCNRAGITFVSVHDCFWTHPNSVNVMNKICREQFVKLHSQPLLKTLSEYFIKRYSYKEPEGILDSMPSVNKEILTRALLSVPPKGNFDLKKVLMSTYFFS